MPIAPTLILGLGGTGSTIVQKVAEKVRETDSGQANRIAYVVFDTDINELARIKQESTHIETVQTSTRNTVGEYLNVNTNARDNWFPVNEMLNRKTLTEGAAQVRAISRLAFDTTLKGGHLDPLHRAIEGLFRIDKDQEEQSLRVIITSSLAGGTGSGLLLPVAMYLANFLRAKYPKAKAITRGFFIQPDIFYSVIKATEEQQNLQVNAYAAIRELDAFLMKGDNTLPARYRNLQFEFPRVGGEGVEVVSAMPYDFCFLFDANKADAGGLDSFQAYLDHAATCIYTLSIGPMSKKSNSREDNVLREVIKNDGRNRYAGAGASRLVYPWQHVRDFVAQKWADFVLSTQWLQFDDQFKDQLTALQRQREDGYSVRDLDLPTTFISLVDAGAQKNEPFAKAVQAQCLAYDADGIAIDGVTAWDTYLGSLKRYVDANASLQSDDRLGDELQGKLAALSEETDPWMYVNTYEELKRYYKLVERHSDERAGILGYSIFKGEGDAVTKDRRDYQLETYLREPSTGAFIHPVSVRYFLYQTLERLKSAKRKVQEELRGTQQELNTFEATAFDDPETEDVVESPEMFAAKRKAGWLEKVRSRPKADLQELHTALMGYVQNVRDLRAQMVWSKVVDEAIVYVTGMAESFQVFFDSLSGNLNRLRTDIELLRTKYDGLSGTTTRYVLAESASLDHLYKSMTYKGSSVSIDSDLAEQIYAKVREYNRLTDEKDTNFFQDLYKGTMIGYFAGQVMKSYGSQIKMDVIEALEREYKAIQRNVEEENVHHYVVQEIDKAKKLAAPFLEQPLGEERHPIQACAYNPRLEGDSDPKRESLIREHLGNYGGAKDPDISEHEILFYNAIYSIRARDLSKYAPARSSVTDRRPAGQYFSSYYRLVSEIKPSVEETKVITPHIDRRWHTIDQLPDLDEANQALQLAGIHGALLGGLAHELIFPLPVPGDGFIYKYRPWRAQDQDLIVSNGTPCDQFYEVVDALTISPVAVAEINDAVRRRIDRLRTEERAVGFNDSDFAKALEKGIPLPELETILKSGSIATATIFDVAAFYALSLPREHYSDGDLRELTLNLLAYLRSSIEECEDPGASVSVIGDVLARQFERFARNAAGYVASEGDVFKRKLSTIIRPLWELLDDLSLRPLATRVDEFDQSLRA